jgi:iron-sulfur cluster repair protein YtfE (RIC family)
MIPSGRVDPVILGHLLGQHRDLHARLLALRADFAVGHDADPPSAKAVRDRLQELRDHLREHFVQEEQGGFLEESIARMPRLSVAAREVVAEHPRLLAELDTLVDKLPTQDVRNDSWDEAAHGFAAFTEHLLAHERNENAVVQQGYNEDFGFGD